MAKRVVRSLVGRTFIFSDVFERKGQASVLALNDPDFAEGALAHDSQQAEVIEIDWRNRSC